MPQSRRQAEDGAQDQGRTDLSTLLTATAAGDRRAFKALYEATNRRLFGIALLMLRRRDAAEDVLQEAYVRVWTEARRYDPAKGPALPWLSRVVRNLAIDYMRRERGPTEDIADHAEALSEPPPPMGDRTDLARGLNRLGADQREILTLAFVQGLTHEELVTRLGLPLGTAKSRVRRGLEQLRAFLESSGPMSAAGAG